MSADPMSPAWTALATYLGERHARLLREAVREELWAGGANRLGYVPLAVAPASPEPVAVPQEGEPSEAEVDLLAQALHDEWCAARGVERDWRKVMDALEGDTAWHTQARDLLARLSALRPAPEGEPQPAGAPSGGLRELREWLEGVRKSRGLVYASEVLSRIDRLFASSETGERYTCRMADYDLRQLRAGDRAFVGPASLSPLGWPVRVEVRVLPGERAEGGGA